MTTHEVLVEARNLLEREGWRQRNWGREQGPRCAHGALLYAAGAYQPGRRFEVELERAASREIQAVVGMNILGFNDARGRTKAEVLAAFDRAIAATAPEPDTSFLPKPTRDPVPA